MADLAKLDQTRQTYRARLTAALEEDEDPLAAYDKFIQWTVDTYPAALIPKSGLLELLEEATRQFKGDKTYKEDPRYMKMWMMYAAYVDDERQGTSLQVYKFLLQNDLATKYARVYEEYALALERVGRRPDAEKVFLHGIKRRARPVERLQKQYAEFQARTAAKASPPSRAPPPSTQFPPSSAWKGASSETQALRKNPLKNHPPSQSKSSSSKSSSSKATAAPTQQPNVPLDLLAKHGHDRYAPMLAPAPPGKRPEKLRFSLSLLFTEDGTEYSVQEVRARSMGLLGKKWAPPPPSELTKFAASTSSSLGSSNSSSGTGNTVKMGGRNNTTRRLGGGYAEPTVTLATKEALADVFGMYNSPEKSTRYGIAGTKHAPVRKIEPVTPMGNGSLQAAFKAVKSDENAGARTPGAFRPYVDENADVRKENNATPAAAKFQIFMDNEEPEPAPRQSKVPQSSERTPGPSQRKALTSKDPSTPLSNENAFVPPRSAKSAGPLRSISEEDRAESPEDEDGRKVFSVFTPVAPKAEARPLSRNDIFIDEPQEPDPPPQFSVFSKPSTHSENPFAPPVRKPAFTPFVDENVPAPESSRQTRPALIERSRTPLQSSLTPSTSTDSDAEFMEQQQLAYAQVAEADGEYYEESESTDQFSDVDDTPAPLAMDTHTPAHSEYGDTDFDDEDEVPAYQVPLGGRLGKFNVMTPITERTLEYTNMTAMSGRATPSDNYSMRSAGSAGGRAYAHLDQEQAKESAEILAAELRHEQEGFSDEEYAEEDLQDMEERTGTLNLSDAIARASSFSPSNPCNPFDGSIISALLSIIPPDSAFHDLRAHTSNQLEPLQKFARKKGRKSTGSAKGNDELSLRVEIAGKKYDVLEKLGEGGFGAVFEAIDLEAFALKRGKGIDEDEDDFDDDFDEDEIPKVALKVVKPRSIWEFHVLRRIHHTLSPNLRRSIINPEALYAFRDESFLVLELRKQGTLLDIVNRAPQAGITQQGACLDELLVMFFSIELMRLLEGLHRAGFIHGDVKIDNCLLRLDDVPGPATAWQAVYDPAGGGGWGYKGIKLIDFGRTIETRLFPPGQRFVGDWATDARDCLEMREGRPWTYQTDYFGLAGIIFCMLYGKYIEAASVVPAAPGPDGHPRYKLAAPFKRYWQGELWTRLFDLLLNPTLAREEGQLPLCDEMAALRGEMEAWLQANCNRASNSLKGLLKKVGLSILGGKDAR